MGINTVRAVIDDDQHYAKKCHYFQIDSAIQICFTSLVLLLVCPTVYEKKIGNKFKENFANILEKVLGSIKKF